MTPTIGEQNKLNKQIGTGLGSPPYASTLLTPVKEKLNLISQKTSNDDVIRVVSFAGNNENDWFLQSRSRKLSQAKGIVSRPNEQHEQEQKEKELNDALLSDGDDAI